MLYILLVGILAGVLLNMMPCVLPILSLKLLALQKAKSKGEVVQLAAFTVFGIISFMAFLSGIFAFVKVFGTSLDWGFQMQMPGFIIFLILILSFLLLVFQGHIKIPIHQAFLQAGSSSGIFLNSFISGFFIVVFSATCSGPLIGSAISMAFLGMHWLTIPIVLMGIGVGLSLPYFLFLAFPNLGLFLRGKAKLSKSLKDVTAAMMLVTILWLFYVLATQIGYLRSSLVFAILAVSTFFARKKASIIVFAASIPVILGVGLLFQREVEEVKELSSAIWEPFSEEKIDYYVNSGRVVLVSIDASWCLTCKGNNLWTFERPATLRFLEENGVAAMKGDLSLPNGRISRFLQSHGVYAVPFTVIYSHKYPNGKVLPPIVTMARLIDELEDAK